MDPIFKSLRTSHCRSSHLTSHDHHPSGEVALNSYIIVLFAMKFSAHNLEKKTFIETILKSFIFFLVFALGRKTSFRRSLSHKFQLRNEVLYILFFSDS